MNKKFYQLANDITPASHIDAPYTSEPLSNVEIKKYSDAVLAQIHGSKTTTRHLNHNRAARSPRRFSQYAATVAACAAAFCLAITILGTDAHAAIAHIRWSIGNALGLSVDLEDYRNVIDTAVMDAGYVVTLQEAVATDDKLVVNCTVQREDGEPMAEPMLPFESLYINGKRVHGGASGGGGFIDDSQTVTGISRSYDIAGVDMSQENTFQLKFDSLEGISPDNKVKGSWDFSFSADGSELIADTKRIPINRTFAIADGINVTLDELSLNRLEQRIAYHADGLADYILKLTAVEPDGKTVEFATKFYDGSLMTGYMQNAEILYDGRVSESADVLTMTLYATELPEESGQMKQDYRQIGDSFELTLP